MKKSKLIMSIITCCFALSVLAFGVYASLSVNFNLSGKITFDPNGADAHIETQVFKYNQEITHDNAYLLASDVQANTIDDFNGDADYTEMEDYYVSYDTKNGNVYDVEHTMSDLQFDFEDCYTYVIVIHVNPNNTSYDLAEHNQIVFGELTLKTKSTEGAESTEFPDGAWLAYNDNHLVIYPSAQEDGLNMILVVGVEQFKEVAETDFTLTLTLSYKDIYVPTENDEISQFDNSDVGSNDVFIRIPTGTCEDGDDFDEIVLPETVEYNGTKNVVGIKNEDGEIFGKKLILNKNCIPVNKEDDFGYPDQEIKDYIIVDQRNEKISSLDNMLFSKDKKILMMASNCYTKYSIPSFVETINRMAFWGSGVLENITIPDSVTKLEVNSLCIDAASIYIPSSVQIIEEAVFGAIDKFYCGATQQPDGWVDDWNNDSPVEWGMTREDYNKLVNA